MKHVYLDYAASSPIDSKVLEAMLPYLQEKYGNASSIHRWGQEARAAVDKARAQVATALGARPSEIIFTGTTTESDNLAIVGIVKAARKQMVKGQLPAIPHIITSAIEHHAVLDVFKSLAKAGTAEVTFLPVDRFGLVNPADVEKAIKDNTVLISIMFANNEVGTVQPISEVGEEVKKLNAIRPSPFAIRFHTDAAAGKYLDLNVDRLGVDLLTLGPHKFYGPKGVGILYVRKGTPLVPLIVGGSHEYGLRPGTENVPAVVGAGLAIELLAEGKEQMAESVKRLRDKLIAGVLERIPESQLTGHPKIRVPDMASFAFRGVEGESILLMLDQEGIAASSGSACTSGLLEPSHVLSAMGLPPEISHGSVRFSFGQDNTAEGVDYVLEKLPGIIERLRQMAPR